MRKRGLLVMGLLVLATGCSRNAKIESPAAIVVESESSTVVAAEETFERQESSETACETSLPLDTEIKLFGEEKLSFVEKDEFGQLVYTDEDGGCYYFDGDTLTLYISKGNADMTSKISIIEIEKKAVEWLARVSPIYSNADVRLEINKDYFGCYEVHSVKNDVKLAVLNYDTAGNLISGNFDVEAYNIDFEQKDKYTKEEIIEAAVDSIREYLGDKFDEFMTDDVVIECKPNIIRGKKYEIVDVFREIIEGPDENHKYVSKVGYEIFVSKDDLSIYLFDQFK